VTHAAHSRAPSPAAVLCLDRARAADRLQVVEITGGREISRLLSQLHIRVGAVLRVERAAPLGGPLLLECEGGTVIVGRRLAEHVRVRVLP
jgi:Fe2+ transport system protein FeoA